MVIKNSENSENKELSENIEPTQRRLNAVVGVSILVGAVLVLLILSFIGLKLYSQHKLPLAVERTPKNIKSSEQLVSDAGESQEISIPKDKLQKFDSEEDFKDYLDKAEKSNQSYFGGFGRGGGIASDAGVAVSGQAEMKSNAVLSTPTAAPAPTAGPSRVSETNVQVLGIDEPDIIKTDGQQIYFSQEENFIRPLMGISERPMAANTKIGVMPPSPYPYPEFQTQTKIVNAFPLENLKLSGKIDKNGDLLLFKKTLIIFSENKHKIYGYNIENPEDPQEKWAVEIKDQDELVGARLYNDKVYLVTRAFIKNDNPCPIEPFVIGGSPVKFGCDVIYHPDQTVPVDLTYNVLSFDAESGTVSKTASFVGSSNSSVLYMSDKSIYLTYDYPGDFVKLFSDFLGLNSDLIPSSTVDKIKKIENYDLSDTAKLTELEDVLGHFTRSLSNDDMMRIQNELTNRVGKFYKEHGRELENTGIVKIEVPDLEVQAMGKVPGKALNQFSLDEYQGNLRIATTSNSNFGWIGGIISGNTSNSISDVYVLNGNLDLVGKALDMGKGERIYSVRFIENRGYVVTFKQMDPFYVLDLSAPKNPEIKGELKIPGYSSYLHPIAENVILGVGQDGGQVKLTLFDTSQPDSPKELNTYRLDEYYTEVSNNFHAFLQDKDHEIFFMPGGKGGYVFSYKDNELKLAKAISEPGVKRAVYINNFLYVIADSKIMVFDENSWDKVKELDL